MHVLAHPRAGRVEIGGVPALDVRLYLVPSPRRKFPPVASASIHAACAVTMGLRANATAIPVPSVRPSVAEAAAVASER